MQPDLLRLAVECRERGESFAVARVVRRLAPSSARVGDQALITADGELYGWIGGACSRDEVIRHALSAIREREPRLLAFAPGVGPVRSGVIELPMNCQSGGTVEVFIEPDLPPRRLLVYGSSPIAAAVGRLGTAMGYDVTVAATRVRAEEFAGVNVESETLSSSTLSRVDTPLFVVVATMGQGDEEALRLGLEGEPEYIAVVASARRFAQIRETLVATGVDPAALDAVHNPAGLDIGARRPEEIAVSILAEMIREERAAADSSGTEASRHSAADLAVDPVCGMEVQTDGTRPGLEHEGAQFWFCCEGCRARFAADPLGYIESAGLGEKA